MDDERDGMNTDFSEPGATRVTYEMDDGVRLVGETFGPDDAPPVVLAHGGGQTRYAWTRVARRLGAAGWHAVALDLRGHGESDWDAAGDYTIPRFGRDLDHVARQFARPPVIVGASLGGNAGLLVAGQGDDAPCRGLVLVDITPKIDEKGVDKIIGFMGRHLEDGFASYDEAAEAIAGYTDRGARRSNRDSLRRYLRERPDGRLRWHWDPQFIVGRKSSRMAPESLGQLEGALAAATVPILLVRGSNSDLVNDASVAEFLRIAPEAQFRDVTGAGHMIVGDRNDVFAETLDDFLNGL